MDGLNPEAMEQWRTRMSSGSWWSQGHEKLGKLIRIDDEKYRDIVKARLKAIGNGQASLCVVVIWRLLEAGGVFKDGRPMKNTRSKIMAAIKNEKTGPEERLHRALTGAGVVGYARNDRTLPGSPDFAFHDVRLAVFVDGCFWHGCPEHYKEPKTNAGYWHKKLDGNRKRDGRADSALEKMGWTSLRVWEHEVTDEPKLVAARIKSALKERKKR